MIIFEKTGKILLDIPVDDTSYRYRAIRQGDKVNLVFSLTEHVEIPVYSYVDYQGQRYTLWRPEDLAKHGTDGYVPIPGHLGNEYNLYYAVAGDRSLYRFDWCRFGS